jgi:hypothetical protein
MRYEVQPQVQSGAYAYVLGMYLGTRGLPR